jgi:hypothetical protein
MSGGLLNGRAAGVLAATQDPTTGIFVCTQRGSDSLFAATLANDWKFSHAIYKNCTFANVSFLLATLDNCMFENCAFLDCYFRKTTITSSVFAACKFEDCTFSDSRFVDATFDFPAFRGCFIPYQDFETQLPDDPGKRYKIADELAREAAASGAAGDARLYRLVGAPAYEKHLWNKALASGSDYYRHFDSNERLKASVLYVRRKINRFVWGYGEKGWVLARSFSIVGALLFPLLFWLLIRGQLRLPRGRPARLIDYELFSFDNLLNRTGFSAMTFSGREAQTLVGAEVLVGLVFIGLFISLIFNWIRRR